MVNRAKIIESILVALVLVIVSGLLFSLRQPVKETDGPVPVLQVGKGQFVDVKSGTRYQGLPNAPLLLLAKMDEDTWWGLTRNGLYYGRGSKVKKVATPEDMGVTPTGGTFSITPYEDLEIIVEGTDSSGDPVEVPITLDPDTGEATPGEPTPAPTPEPTPEPTPSDTTAPVITILSPNPLTLVAGTPYVELGATAFDETDGDLTSSIVITGSVDTSTPGVYFITYSVSDAAGNTASAILVVIVEAPAPPPSDTTPPVITILGSNPVTTMHGPYYDAGATATDDVDGDITDKIVVTSTIEITSSEVLPATPVTPGTYTVTYTVSDTAGNTAVAVRTVIVESPPAPTPVPTPAPPPSSPGFVYLPGSCIVATPCCGGPSVICAVGSELDLCAFTISPSGTPTSTGIIPAATLTTVVVATPEEIAAAAEALATDTSAATSTTSSYTVTAYLTSDPSVVDVVITGPPGPVLLKWWSLDPPVLAEATVITLSPTGETLVMIPSPIILTALGTTIVSIPYDPTKVLYLQANPVESPLYPGLPDCGETFEEPIAEPVDPGAVGFAVADHFTCYPVTGTSPNKRASVWDQFGMRGLQVQKTKKLCTPAVKKVGTAPLTIAPVILPGYPDKHYVCYKAQSGWLGAISWVLDQFGQNLLYAEYQDELCVPAIKTVTAFNVGRPDPAPKGNTSIDHWNCFPVMPKKVNQVVTIRDQFGQREIIVDQLKRLCVPADKQWDNDPLRQPQTQEHFLCYNVTQLKPVRNRFAVTAVDQFNRQNFIIADVEELCVPAKKQFLRFNPPPVTDTRVGSRECSPVPTTRFCAPIYDTILEGPCFGYYTGPSPTWARACGTKYFCGLGPLYPLMEC